MEAGPHISAAPRPGRWAGLADMSAAFYEVLSPDDGYGIIAQEFRSSCIGNLTARSPTWAFP
jgi:hypothetical protein